MADYVPAWIEIGGQIARELVPELIDCIQSEGVSDSFGGGAIEARSADDLLALARDKEGHPGTLKLYDEQVHNGEFDYLECFLEEHAVPFNRHSDGVAEFCPEVVRFRPGWPAPTTTIVDNLGREVVAVGYVNEALEMLRAGKVDDAIEHLAALVGEGIPVLMPLEIVA